MGLRRRRILRAGVLALVGSVAGCSGRDDPGPERTTFGIGSPGRTDRRSIRDPTGNRIGSDSTETDSVVPLGTTRSVSGDPVAVTEVAVLDSVFYLPYPDELGVKAGEGWRYVFVRIETPSGGPERHAFELLTDPGVVRGGVPSPFGIVQFDDLYDGGSDGKSGWLGFRVPAPLEGDEIRVAVDGAAWAIPDRHVERLRRPKPTFELVEFAVPEAVEVNSAFDVAATFENAGDRSGTLRAAMAVQGAGFPCCNGPRTTVDVPAGGRETWHESLGGAGAPRPGYGEVQIRLKSPAGTHERTVTVNEATTTRSPTTEGE